MNPSSYPYPPSSNPNPGTNGSINPAMLAFQQQQHQGRPMSAAGGINPTMLSQQGVINPSQLLPRQGGGMGGMMGMGNMGMGMNFNGMGGMGNMGGLGSGQTINPSMLGSSQSQGQGGGTINPAMMLSSSNSNSSSNPSVQQQSNAASNSGQPHNQNQGSQQTQNTNQNSAQTIPGLPPQLASLSPQELQMMQAKVMAQRQAMLAGSGGNMGGMGNMMGGMMGTSQQQQHAMQQYLAAQAQHHQQGQSQAHGHGQQQQQQGQSQNSAQAQQQQLHQQQQGAYPPNAFFGQNTQQAQGSVGAGGHGQSAQGGQGNMLPPGHPMYQQQQQMMQQQQQHQQNQQQQQNQAMNQGQQRPPPRPSTAMSMSGSSQTSPTTSTTGVMGMGMGNMGTGVGMHPPSHVPTRPPTSMSMSGQSMGPMQGQMQGMGISRPGTASGVHPHSMQHPQQHPQQHGQHGQQQAQHQMHSPVQQHSPLQAQRAPLTPVIALSHPQNQMPQLNQSQNQREMSRPPSRPQTAGSNHGAVAPPTPTQQQMASGMNVNKLGGGLPGTSNIAGAMGSANNMSPTRPMSMAQQQQMLSQMQRSASNHGQMPGLMGNLANMQTMGMQGMAQMQNMQNMGMKFPPQGQNQAQQGPMNPAMMNQSQMNGLGSMSGMPSMGGMNAMGAPLMGGAGGGMMPPPSIPRQGSQGSLHPPQTPTQQQQSPNTNPAMNGAQAQAQQQNQFQPGRSPSLPPSASQHQAGEHQFPPQGMHANGTDFGAGHGLASAQTPASPFADPNAQHQHQHQQLRPGTATSLSGAPSDANANNEMQLRQMQMMNERKAIAMAALQQQQRQQGHPGGQPMIPTGIGAVNPQLTAMQMQTPQRPGTAGGRGSAPPTPASIGAPGMLGAIAPMPPVTPVRPGTSGPVASASTTTTTATPASAAVSTTNGVTTTPGASSNANSLLPPLPASVQLNPAVTKVTAVPLAQSRTLIPTLTAEEIRDIQGWMATDREYESRFRAQRERTKSEVLALGGPHAGRWWERDPATEAVIATRRKKEKFDLIYPHMHSQRDGGRKKSKRREGLKLPGRVKNVDAERAEQLVPVRLEFDVEHQKYRDTFVWNLNDSVVTPEIFAQSVIDDYGLSSSYHSIITKSIQEQLSDFKAHSALLAELDTPSPTSPIGTRAGDPAPGPGILERGVLDEEDVHWWSTWRRRLRNADGFVKTRSLLRSSLTVPEPPVRSKKRRKTRIQEDMKEEKPIDEYGPMEVDCFEVDEDKMHEEMRILIKIDVTVGSMKLDDQFEWDIESPEPSPEQFAEIYGNDLGLAGEFKTAIAHSIREQVSTYQKSLFLVGHPSDGSAVQDDDLRMSFLPYIGAVARSVDSAQSNQPIINYLSDGELDRIDKEREKELNKRRKRNTRGRRGITLPDREPLKSHRTPAIGFPELDPSTLALAAAAAAPTSRRAAAAAASLTIANMVASENGTALIQPTIPMAPSVPSLPTSKIPKAKGSFKAPSYPGSVLKFRANVTTPTPSTAADASTFEPPLEGDPPLPALSSIAVAPDSKASKAITARRQRELEKEAKEKEFADGQRANMIDGVWHCSNCGCPDNIAIGRRKGPLGDKSQCGACGKFWHRHRRPRPVEYNTDPDYHINLKMEAEKVKASAKKRGGAAALRALNIQQDQPATPAASVNEDQDPSPYVPKNEVWVEIKTPRKSRPPSSSEAYDGLLDRPLSPASSVSSSASERPLAAVLQVNGAGHNRSSSLSKITSEPPPQTEDASSSYVKETSQSEPPLSVTPTPTAQALEATPSIGTPPPRPPKPQWFEDALVEMQAKYPDDKFAAILRKTAVGGPSEWRLKCLDCPGKLYTPGPGETLNNYEIHLKNRQHRAKVHARITGST